MTVKETVSPDAIRAMFASALSDMYRHEVPQYGTLLKLVSDINHQRDPNLQHRVEVERHGAIRLGTASELATMRRLFSVMGMHPVGYYDLTVASLPVHATCFRPLTKEALAYNPFRVFTSLLRLELIQDQELRSQAAEILSKRNIFTTRYIEAAQTEMLRYGLHAKDAIEGPPPRSFPILLRQTSFLALDEAIAFSEGAETGGSHKARFGEIEQRGMALTPKGRRLYDDLINEWREATAKLSPGAKPESKEDLLAKVFTKFPDNLESLRREELAYFTYKLTSNASKLSTVSSIDELIDAGAIELEPITYEDFLPVSAAGIFHSNLGDDTGMVLCSKLKCCQ
ncbi:DUF1338 domain [Fusarium albosuccineum]|uniref:2-oxoadipate dioxygenase/decarboxylase n=1 Tax=Fusarium albosuccineum TaxID=1237068 RepID=A0A8H4LIZ9_9HYPO|nr:DUF1338 domain [Fusarium albosuccineum]